MLYAVAHKKYRKILDVLIKRRKTEQTEKYRTILIWTDTVLTHP